MDAHRPSLSAGAWRALTVRRPARVPGAVLRLPTGLDPRARARRGRRSAAVVLTDPLTREVLWFSRLAGDRVDGADDPRRASCFVRPRPVHVSRSRARFRDGDRSVRAPDGGRRARVPRGASRRARTRLGGDPARSRLLQRRRRRADRRDLLGRARPTGLRSRCDARRGTVAQLSRRDASAARARARGRGLDRLPLLVHLVRRRPHPRRAAATRPSRRRSTTRPSASSTSVPLPPWRSCSWSASRSSCGLRRGSKRSSPSAGAAARRDVLRPLRTPGEKAFAAPRSAHSRSSSAFRSRSSSSARSPSARDTASRPIARSRARRTRCSRARGRRS